MKHIKNNFILLIFIAFLTMGCVACGLKATSNGSMTKNGGEFSEYSIEEHALPDANTNLITESDYWVRELDIKMAGDKVYRLAQLWGQDPEYNVELDLGYFIQISEYPFTEWKSYEAPFLNLDGEYEATDTRHGYHPCKITGIYDDTVYFAAAGLLENEKSYYALGKMDSSGIYSLTAGYPIIQEEPEYDPFCNDIFFDGKDTVYSYQTNPSGNDVISYKISSGYMHKDSYPASIERIRISKEGKAIWYGNKEDSFCGGEAENMDNAVACKNEEESSSVEGAMQAHDGWYFSDAKSLKVTKDDKTSEELIDWRSRGYNFSTIHEMEVKDNALQMLTDFEGRHYVIVADLDSQKMVSKQEVVISMPFEIPSLNYYISVFNRRSTEYHVSISLPEDPEDMEKYQTDLNKAFASGEGPDIIINGIMNQKNMVRGGLIAPVDDLVTDKSAYFEGALKSGQFEEVQYGIPYEFYFDTAAYSGKLFGDSDSITLNDFIDKATEMDAKAVALGLTGEEIVFKYGFYDEKNTTFIDWTEKKSHLDSQEFIDFINFVARYAGSPTIDEGNYKDKLDAGAVMSESMIIGDPERMNYLDACFDGNVSLAGYPRTEGCGVYMTCNMLYLNSKAECTDGAKAFLKFIISQDAQMLVAENRYVNDDSQSQIGNFPVEKEAFYREIELAQMQKASEKANSSMNGISYPSGRLSRESAEKIKTMAEKACPVNSELDDIVDIIYEELEPFFAGQRSAEDVANVMSSRVQIYLDE